MKKSKASILVVTLVIMGILLVTALSVSLVSIREKIGSIAEGNSGRAYQVADTGIEKVMDMLVHNRNAMISALANNNSMSCSVNMATNHAILAPIASSSPDYTVELKKRAESDPTSCSDYASSILSIKSVGVYNNQEQRAIEAAVASSAPECQMADGTTNGPYAGYTTSLYAGNMNGYGSTGANSKCSGIGTHVCSAQEIMTSINCGGITAATLPSKYWYNSGILSQYATRIVNDCAGWTSNSSGVYGAVWDGTVGIYEGSPGTSPCSMNYQVLCCKD